MKRVIRLTESDLARIVKRVMNEGAVVVSPWSNIKNVATGDTMKTDSKGGVIFHFKNGKRGSAYNGYTIIQNPRQVQLDQVGAMNVISFDPTRKTVTFQNGVVIGPA